MNDFAKWRYALIAVVLILGAIYALPNMFLPQPAVQVSANRTGTVDRRSRKRSRVRWRRTSSRSRALN